MRDGRRASRGARGVSDHDQLRVERLMAGYARALVRIISGLPPGGSREYADTYAAAFPDASPILLSLSLAACFGHCLVTAHARWEWKMSRSSFVGFPRAPTAAADRWAAAPTVISYLRDRNFSRLYMIRSALHA